MVSYTPTAAFNTAGSYDAGRGGFAKTVTVTASVGDLLVAWGGAENYESQWPGPPNIKTDAGSTTAWTLNTPDPVAQFDGDFVSGYATVQGSGSITVNMLIRCQGHMGGGVWVVPAAQWTGTPTFFPSQNEADAQWNATLGATSTVLMAGADYAAGTYSTLTPAGGTFDTNSREGGVWSGFAANWTGQAAGTRSYGVSGQSADDISGAIIVIPEVYVPPTGATFRSAGAFAYSATSGTTVTPAYPAGLNAGDLLVLFVAQKPSTANAGTVTTPAGWTPIGNTGFLGGYATTTGADVGNTCVYAYSHVSDGTETGTLSVTVGTNSVCTAYIVSAYAASGNLDTPAYAIGSRDTTPTSPLSVASTTSLDTSNDDLILWAFSSATDVTTPAQYSNEALAQSGAVFGTTNVLGEWDTTNGNDMGGVAGHSKVTTGGTGAITFSSTLAGTLTNVRGPLMLVRLRAAAAGNNFTQSLTATSSLTGSFLRGPRKNAAVTSTTTSTFRRAGSRTLPMTSTLTPSALKTALLTRSTSVTATAAFTRARALTVSATSSTVSTVSKAASKTTSATVGLVGSLSRGLSKTVLGTANTSTSSLKAASRTLASSIVGTTATALSEKTAGLIALTLNATVSSSATLRRSASKSFSPVVTTAANYGRTLSKTFGLTVSLTPSFRRALSRTYQVTVAGSPAIQKLVQVTKSMTISASPSVQKSASKTVSATSTMTASIQALKAFLKTLNATVSTSAQFSRRLALVRTLAASVSPSATLRRSMTRTVSVVQITAASCVKSAAKTVARTVTSSASVNSARAFLREMAVTVTTSASARRLISKSMAVPVNLSPEMIKKVSKTIADSVLMTASAVFGSVRQVTLTTLVTTTSAVSRTVGKTSAVVVTVTETFSKAIAKSVTFQSSLIPRVFRTFRPLNPGAIQTRVRVYRRNAPSVAVRTHRRSYLILGPTDAVPENLPPDTVIVRRREPR